MPNMVLIAASTSHVQTLPGVWLALTRPGVDIVATGMGAAKPPLLPTAAGA